MATIFDYTDAIQVNEGGLNKAAEAGMTALANSGLEIYRRSQKVVYISKEPIKDRDGNLIYIPQIVPMPRALLRAKLAYAATWLKYDKKNKDLRPIDVPNDVVLLIESWPEKWPFRPLTGILGTQTIRRDGTIIDKPGYDRKTGYYLSDPPEMPPILEFPTFFDALNALDLIDGLLDEFPFVDGASRSVLLSLLMTVVVRAALGVVPIHATSAPVGGSGKTYPFHICSTIAYGERCAVMSRAVDDNETEKRLIGAALEGRPIIAIDNCNGLLKSEFLSQVSSEPRLDLRPLGTSRKVTIINSFSTVASGNNIEFAFDIIRRVIKCSLDANMERPELRKFNNNPITMIMADRGKYVAAILTIVRAYLVAGSPSRPIPLAGFEDWNDFVRAPLIWLGCDDPLLTMDKLSLADPVRQVRAKVYSVLAAMPRNARGYTTAEIIQSAQGNPDFIETLVEVAGRDDTGAINSKSLGRWLRRSKDQICEDMKLVLNDEEPKRLRWVLVREERGG